MRSSTSSPDTPPNWWARIRQKRWVRWGIDLGVMAVIFTTISMWQARDFVESGTLAPDFELTDLNGTSHSLQSYAGKKTVIVFWAPWCPVCGAESDNLSRIQSWLGDRVNVISIVLDYRNRGAIQEFMSAHQVDYPVLLGTRQTAVDYQVSVFPSLYVLDEKGRVEHSVVGYTTTFGLFWRVLI